LILSLDIVIAKLALPALDCRPGAATTGLERLVDGHSLVFAALVLAAGSARRGWQLPLPGGCSRAERKASGSTPR
jgi:hypothetical protein